MYEIKIEGRVFKDLRRIPQQTLELLQKRIQQLQDNPRPNQCQKLQGYANRYRIKQGDYRILYTIDDKTKLVNVLYIRHRKDIYRVLN